MENLAGDLSCDSAIRKELKEAGITVVDVGPSNREVPYTVEGRLGSFKFWRAWYYWVVEGYVPLEVAKTMYANPVGKKDVRVDGHCGCPDPVYWAGLSQKEYDKYKVYLDKETVPPEWQSMFEGHKTIAEIQELFVKTMETLDFKTSHIRCYHIDSQEGLNLFAATIRKNDLDKSNLISSEGGYVGAFGQKYGSLQDGAPDSQRKNEGTW
jgi:hypothetical protein